MTVRRAQEAPHAPQGRYPARTARRRWPAVTAMAVAFAILVTWTVWIAARHANPDVAAGVRAFKVTSDRTVEITLEVRKAAGASATCEVSSRAFDGSEAGHGSVEIGPSADGKRTTVVTTTLDTSQRGITGEVGTCHLVAKS